MKKTKLLFGLGFLAVQSYFVAADHNMTLPPLLGTYSDIADFLRI